VTYTGFVVSVRVAHNSLVFYILSRPYYEDLDWDAAISIISHMCVVSGGYQLKFQPHCSAIKTFFADLSFKFKIGRHILGDSKHFQWTILSNQLNSIQTLFKGSSFPFPSPSGLIWWIAGKRLSRRQAVTYVSTFDMPRSLRTLKTGVQFSLSVLTDNPSSITLNFSMALHDLHGPRTLFFFCYELFFFVRERAPFPHSHPLAFALLLAISTNSRQNKVKPVYNGHPWEMARWPLRTRLPLYTGFL